MLVFCVVVSFLVLVSSVKGNNLCTSLRMGGELAEIMFKGLSTVAAVIIITSNGIIRIL